MLNQRAMNQYNYANAAGVLNASPQQVISLLMQGALDRMTSAKGCIANDDIAGRNLLLGKAIDIIDCLKSSLEHKHDEEMTANLDSLYDYMNQRLFQANLKNSPDIIDEVYGLLNTIYDGWKQLEEQGPELASQGQATSVSPTMQSQQAIREFAK